VTRACAASSCELHLDNGTWRCPGGSHATAFTPATTSDPNVRGRPDRGRSFNPSKPCSQKRFRHREATSTQTPTLSAISMLRAPSAAINTIRARTTTACDAFRDDARSSRTVRSSRERTTSNGELRHTTGLPNGQDRPHKITPLHLSATPLAVSQGITWCSVTPPKLRTPMPLRSRTVRMHPIFHLSVAHHEYRCSRAALSRRFLARSGLWLTVAERRFGDAVRCIVRMVITEGHRACS
jgi:hypothetical protein